VVRIAIAGNSGSGKTTLARRAAAKYRVPVLHLDSVVWEPDQIAVARPPEEQRAAIDRFAAENSGWVVEGCYGTLLQIALRHSPELWFLDIAEERCLENCRSRPWEPDKYPSKEAQDERLPALLDWVKGYYTREGELSRRAHEALFENYAGRKQRFTDRVEP
jgi:adenylate kinase family enzyme